MLQLLPEGLRPAFTAGAAGIQLATALALLGSELVRFCGIAGMQLALLVVLVVLITIAGTLFEERGVILTMIILVYALTSVFGGYASGSHYARSDGKVQGALAFQRPKVLADCADICADITSRAVLHVEAVSGRVAEW